MSAPFRSVVITGATSGIGRALAEHYANPGVALLLLGRASGPLGDVLAVCSGKGALAEADALDVRDAGPLAARLAAFDARHPVDLIIANAGIERSLGPGRSAEPLDHAVAQLRTNLEGAINTVTPLIEPMRARRRGAIVLVSSLAGLSPVPDQPAYSASKAGLIAWGECLIPWLKPDGISVSIVCPGFVATRMKDGYRGARPFEMSAQEAARRIARGVETGRATIAFPWPMAMLVRLGMIVPAPLRRYVAYHAFRSEIEADD